MDNVFKDRALEYHKNPTPGKLAIKATKPLTTQEDLSLAYSPGVAAACEEIEKDPLKALDYTSRGNMVAVITNGTAVLGLGNIGPLASKPVMEGKSVLFKKFANIDSIDIEVDETDVNRFVEAVAALEPSFGGINLEDIKAPECFEIEAKLRERMNIPVFHDDQHGTAIIVGAAFTNWLEISGRKIEDIKLVCSGAGASAMACLKILNELGLPKENIIVCDRKGVVYKDRKESMDPIKEQFASDTSFRKIEEAMKDADVFLGLSGPGAVTQDMVATMNDDPLVMALANPTPEIMPELVKEVKPNAVICTGRSDYTNQVNNVLCFPFIFRGALDVGASEINEEMKVACVKAIADLAKKETVEEVSSVYATEKLEFGPEYIIPKAFDPRLIVDLPIAVAKAAMDTGVATRPITDWDRYAEKLQSFFSRTSLVMRPVFNTAKTDPKRIAYSEGEEENVLRAAQIVVDENLGYPVLIGRRHVVETRIRRLRLRLEIGKNCDLVDPEDDPRYREYWTTYHEIMQRRGVTPAMAKTVVRTNTTVIAALMVYKDDADGLICGTLGQFQTHRKHVVDILGLKDGVETAAALNILILSKGTYFVCDTHINPDPSIQQLTEMTLMAADEIRRFGITPKVALLSHSNFGTHSDEKACKMSCAVKEIKTRSPDLEIDGEMHADAALSEAIRVSIMPHSTLNGQANLLVMPDVSSANIAFNMLKILSDGISIGPVLLGLARPSCILTSSATSRSIVNASALISVKAQAQDIEKAAELAGQKKFVFERKQAAE